MRYRNGGKMNSITKNQKFSKKKLAMIVSACLIAALSLCVLGACQGNGNNGSQIKVKDLTGKEFKFDEPIKKVVSTHNPILNDVVVLGNGTTKYLAGFGNKDKANELYKRILTDWDTIELIGSKGNPVNKEKIVELHPNLALVPENLAAMKDKDYEGTGVDPFVCKSDKEDINSVPDSIKLTAELFGEQERANTVSDKYYEIMNLKKDEIANTKEKPKVLFMGGSKYKVATADMIQTQLIEAAGGINVAKDEFDSGFFADADAESIVKMNPDVIWFPNYAKFTVDDILNDEKLQSVNAVKNKKVYKFPCNLEPWDYPTCSACLGACWAKTNLHPDVFSKQELYKACDEFYKLLYNKTFTPEEMGITN